MDFPNAQKELEAFCRVNSNRVLGENTRSGVEKAGFRDCGVDMVTGFWGPSSVIPREPPVKRQSSSGDVSTFGITVNVLQHVSGGGSGKGDAFFERRLAPIFLGRCSVWQAPSIKVLPLTETEPVMQRLVCGFRRWDALDCNGRGSRPMGSHFGWDR